MRRSTKAPWGRKKACICALLALLLLWHPFPQGPMPAWAAGAAENTVAEAPSEEEPPEEITSQELAADEADLAQLVADPQKDLREKLNEVFRRYTTMGASVAFIQNGKVTFTHVYGDRLRNEAPVTEDTAFQVGSIGKMVVGIGLMQLVEQGKAGLDDDIGGILGFPIRNPHFPDVPITLRQVMSHTASLRDNGFYQAALYGRGEPLSQLFVRERLSYLFYSDIQPGSRYEYSNFGGGIAGSLLEKLSGQTVDDYMKEHVFGPLGITAGYQAALLPESLFLADMYEMPSKRRIKTLREDPTRIVTPQPEKDYILTAGKLIISAPDLAKLLAMLCEGGVYQGTTLLKGKTVLEMTSPQGGRGSVAGACANGLFMNIIENNQVEGRLMFGHGGKANGMLCAAYFDPKDRTGVVMLTNGCNNRKTYNRVGMLGRAVMRVCYGELLDPDGLRESPFLVVD